MFARHFKTVFGHLKKVATFEKTLPLLREQKKKLSFIFTTKYERVYLLATVVYSELTYA